MHRMLILLAAFASLALPAVAGERPVLLAQSGSQERCFEVIRACMAGCSAEAEEAADAGCLESCPSFGLCGSDELEADNAPGARLPAGKLPRSKLPGSHMPDSRLPVGHLN